MACSVHQNERSRSLKHPAEVFFNTHAYIRKRGLCSDYYIMHYIRQGKYSICLKWLIHLNSFDEDDRRKRVFNHLLLLIEHNLTCRALSLRLNLMEFEMKEE